MGNHRTGLLVACAAAALLLAAHLGAGEPPATRDGEEPVRRLLAENRRDREQALEACGREYGRRRHALMEVLATAATNHRKDRSWLSPLHCAILGVRSLHVLRADGELFDLIDYSIDVQTIPMGQYLLGKDLFPAVAALIELRVDRRRVLTALGRTTQPRRLRLLLFVLNQRAGSAEWTRSLLREAAEAGQISEQRLAEAMELLENPSDLLPPSDPGE
jgi:hypothetical protein